MKETLANGLYHIENSTSLTVRGIEKRKRRTKRKRFPHIHMTDNAIRGKIIDARRSTSWEILTEYKGRMTGIDK